MFKQNSFVASAGARFILSLLILSYTGMAHAQALPDTDGDGVIDALDNCLEAPNGGAETGGQRDSDRDGYGDACDADYNNDNITSTADFPRFLAAFAGETVDPVTDHSGDGQTTSADFPVFLAAFRSRGAPGPSGLDCAGRGGVCEAHEEAGPNVSEQEATENDLALLAEAKALPLQDVRRAIGFQEDFLLYAQDLAERYPGRFSRIWLEPVPAMDGVIEFIGDAPSESTPSGITLLGGGSIAQEDHELRAELAAEAINDTQRGVATYFDVRRNQIIVEFLVEASEIPDSQEVFNLVSAHIGQSPLLKGAARLLTPGDLLIRQGQAPVPDWSRGGEVMTTGSTNPINLSCTSGWAVEGPNGDGIVTAGHCVGLNKLLHLSFVHETVWRDQTRDKGDSEYHTTDNIEIAQFSARNGQIRSVLSKKSTFWIIPGQAICRYGRASNFRDCSHTVLAKNVTVTFTDGVTTRKLVMANGDSAIGGDSGGGWSWGTKAWGVHSGSNGTVSFFTPIGRVESELNVDLMIAP